MQIKIGFQLALCVRLMLILPEARAQSDREYQSVTHISIVALGPKPTRKFKDVSESDVPVMLLAKPGETPPSRLYYRGKFDGKKQGDWESFNISFNNPSAMQPVTSGKPLVLFRKSPGGNNEYQRYVTIPAGVGGSRKLVFLLPSGTGSQPWMKPPKVRTFSPDAESYKGKQFILKNFSRFTVLHTFEKSVVSVVPNKTISYQRANTDQLYRLTARYGSDRKVIYNTGVRLSDEGHVQLYVLYDANPKTNANRSVGVFRMVLPAIPKFEGNDNGAEGQ